MRLDVSRFRVSPHLHSVVIYFTKHMRKELPQTAGNLGIHWFKEDDAKYSMFVHNCVLTSGPAPFGLMIMLSSSSALFRL
jgi:hypothetical protein